MCPERTKLCHSEQPLYVQWKFNGHTLKMYSVSLLDLNGTKSVTS